MRLLTSQDRICATATERSLTLLRVFLGRQRADPRGRRGRAQLRPHARAHRAVARRQPREPHAVRRRRAALGARPRRTRCGRPATSPRCCPASSGTTTNLVTVKVWRPDGVLAWTNRAQGRIGRRFGEEDDLAEAMHGHDRRLRRPALDEDEDAVEQLARLRPSAPGLRADPLGRKARRCSASTRSTPTRQGSSRRSPRGKQMIWGPSRWCSWRSGPRSRCSFAARRERSAGRRGSCDERSRDLLDSYERLEESSLEAIESLNATVEAKDPNTAGHSTARPAGRARDRRGARPARRSAWTPCASARSSTTSARSPSPTRSSQAREARLLGVRPDEDALGRGRAHRR